MLDIGTGTGILAVMAARAGAAHVYACEVNAVLCDIAREVLERCALTLIPTHQLFPTTCLLVTAVKLLQYKELLLHATKGFWNQLLKCSCNVTSRSASMLRAGACDWPFSLGRTFSLMIKPKYLSVHTPNWLVSCCRNGVADRVTVIHKSSGTLKPGIDLPERGVDVVVTELVDSGLLGERIVPVLADARARGLLAKGGRAIPEVFILCACAAVTRATPTHSRSQG